MSAVHERAAARRRRGQFFSLTAVLFVVVLLAIFHSQESALEEQRDFRALRAQLVVMDTFARNFETLDISRMLQVSSKAALTSRSLNSPFSPIAGPEFVDIMRDGSEGGTLYFTPLYGTDAQFLRVQATLPRTGEEMNFTYELVEADQASPGLLRLRFLVDYSFSAIGARWKADDLPYDIYITPYSVRHPIHQSIIDETWLVNSSGCLAELVFVDAAPACNGDLRPPWTEVMP